MISTRNARHIRRGIRLGRMPVTEGAVEVLEKLNRHGRRAWLLTRLRRRCGVRLAHVHDVRVHWGRS